MSNDKERELFGNPLNQIIDHVDIKFVTDCKFDHMSIDLNQFNQFIRICERKMKSPTYELNKFFNEFIEKDGEL